MPADPRRQRLRDPVHGLIVFDEDEPLDQLAWALLNTPEFQRLRRIKQLGVSEFVFPGATHTRFAHCIGVYCVARKLSQVIEREHRRAGSAFDPHRRTVALLAALLHDVGHGPFSHAFEHAYAATRDAGKKDHEAWTAEIILNPEGSIRPLLDGYRDGASLADDIADLLTRDNPVDIWHAVVSSSFDADRLDYLRRDRLMTGSGAGAIDVDWLIDNLVVRDIDAGIDDEAGDRGMETPSLCLRQRALQAAEQFLLARYHLYTQVYLHKTTRCVEAMLRALLEHLARRIRADGGGGNVGLADGHPLVRFFAPGGDSLPNYLQMDDTVVWSAIGAMRTAPDAGIAMLAGRLLDRRLYKVLDCDAEYDDNEKRRRAIHRCRAEQEKQNAGDPFAILADAASLSAYGSGEADESKAHKRLMILAPDGRLTEISDRSATIGGLASKRIERFFFADADLRDRLKGRA